jgi:hypothetical protein
MMCWSRVRFPFCCDCDCQRWEQKGGGGDQCCHFHHCRVKERSGRYMAICSSISQSRIQNLKKCQLRRMTLPWILNTRESARLYEKLTIIFHLTAFEDIYILSFSQRSTNLSRSQYMPVRNIKYPT